MTMGLKVLVIYVSFLTICVQVGRASSIFSQIVRDNQFMTRSHSPYFIRELIEIEKTGTLTIESGVTINFLPGAGIIVRGALVAKVYS